MNSNELLSESHDKYNELNPIYDGIAGEVQLTSELVKIRAHYKQACRVKNKVKSDPKAKCQHALQDKCGKWERSQIVHTLRSDV